MVDSTIAEKVNEYSRQVRELAVLRSELSTEVGGAIADRLLALFDARSLEDQKSWPTFDQWFGAQFNYDTYSVFVIMNEDVELKELVAYARLTGSQGELSAVRVVNERFKSLGYKWGLDRQMSNLAQIK